jgi:hypothetical protein
VNATKVNRYHKLAGRWLRGAAASVVLAVVCIIAVPGVAANASTTTKCVTDGAIATKLCMSFAYNQITLDGTTYVEVTHASASATKLDSGAVLQNVRAGVFSEGITPDGSKVVTKSALVANHNNPTPGSYYGGSPTWSNFYVSTNAGQGFYVCAVGGLKWAIHGTSHTYLADYCLGLGTDQLPLTDRENAVKTDPT